MGTRISMFSVLAFSFVLIQHVLAGETKGLSLKLTDKEGIVIDLKNAYNVMNQRGGGGAVEGLNFSLGKESSTGILMVPWAKIVKVTVVRPKAGVTSYSRLPVQLILVNGAKKELYETGLNLLCGETDLGKFNVMLMDLRELVVVGAKIVEEKKPPDEK